MFFVCLRRLLLIAGCLMLVPVGHVVAGVSCEEVAGAAGSMRQAIALARRVTERLDDSGARVALVARVGQDLSKYRLRFSHFGFVLRDHPDGRWSVVHVLNLCGTDLSQLYVQGLGNFFSDDVFAYEAAILTLPEDVQLKLEAVLTSASRMKRLHEPKYSVVAYPFNTRYQNSNQWALEILASAMAPDGDVATRSEAQKWLQASGYEPSLLLIPTMTRLGGRMFKANVAFDDHPDEHRWNDRIFTVTVDSAYDFLRKRYPQNSKRVLVDLD